MLSLIASVIPGLFKLGDKMIEDKDQKAQYAFETQKMTHEFILKMLESKTYPWVDALVKLSYAGEQITKGLFRPLISTGALAFVMYASYNGVELSPMIEGVLLSLAPAWGVSRYKEKKAKMEEVEKVKNFSDLGW